MLAEPSPASLSALRAMFAGGLSELFFAIVWAGENSSRSFILPLFRETLSMWGTLGVRCPLPLVWGLWQAVS
jgi:hypothetical protein